MNLNEILWIRWNILNFDNNNIILMAEMAVFNVADNLKCGRRKWSVIYSFPTETNSKSI